ncbi:MAG TPA: M14 family zinc carboxypeptidase [Actinomycetota bacterium]|nr:M14 family zinc carboxypeptidase [Actinomycetota bacterium]
MRALRRLVAPILCLALLGGALPTGIAPAIALPNPVATDEPTYQAFGRVFPDPQGCLAYGVEDGDGDGVKDTPRGISPWAKGRACADQFLSYEEVIEGAKFLSRRFGRFVQVIRLDQAFDNPNYRSAGIPRTVAIDDGKPKPLARDRRPLYMFKVTDSKSPVPEKDRHHFAYSLSIHGIERAGLEGGVRAMEDLVTWAACEQPEFATTTPACMDEGPFPKKIVESPSEKPVPTAGETLRQSVLWFALPNPDGWARGQTAPVEIEDGSPNINYLPGAMFQRFNGNGVDLNRDFPTEGFTYRPYSPGSEPETKAFSEVFTQIKNNLSSGHFTGGLDLHGMATARAFSYTLLGAGQHDYRKNAITLDTALRTWQDQTLRMKWSPYVADANGNGQVDSGETTFTEPVFGGGVPAPVADSWGSVIDTLGYQITGGMGDWFDSPIGLDAVGIDNEMYLSHLAPNNVFEPALEQTHIDGNKGLIYSQLAALVLEEPHTYEPENEIGYIYNPNRVQVAATERMPNPGMPAQNDIEVVLPCDANVPGNLEGSCGGGTFNAAAAPTFEFDIKGSNEGIWNGGVTVEYTGPNANGISPGAVGNVALEYLDEGTWQRIAVSRTSEGTNYSQAGKIVTVNDPEAGRWRVAMTGAGMMPSRIRIDFHPHTAEASPGQAPIDASSMDFFTDLNKFVPDEAKLTAVEVASVAADPSFARQFDSLVVVNRIGSKNYLVEQLGLTSEQADAYFANLRHYVETGGNLVLTDAALQALVTMGVVPDGAVQENATNPAGSFNFSLVSNGALTYEDPERWPLTAGVDLPGAAEGTRGRRQAAEPVPLGYTPDSGLDTDPRMPIWSVRVPDWNNACTAPDAMDCTTALVTQNRYLNTTSNIGQVDLGEISLGDGRIRIAGEMFPDPIYEPDEFSDHRFGLASYALTYTAYIVFENLMKWDNPGRIEPREAPFVTTLSFTETSASSGQHTDDATIETVLVDDLGAPIEGAPLALDLSTASGVLETATATTDSAGLARFTIGLDELPGEYGLRISFAGDESYLPTVADTSFLVLKETTATALSATYKGARTASLVATLTEDDGPGVAGRTIVFYADAQRLGEAVTNESGVATLAVPAQYGNKKTAYTATFEGDQAFETSSGQLAAR